MAHEAKKSFWLKERMSRTTKGRRLQPGGNDEPMTWSRVRLRFLNAASYRMWRQICQLVLQ